MVPRLSRALAVMLVAGALLAGCGGGKSTTGARSTAAPAATSSTSTTGSTPSTPPTGAPGSRNVRQALEACKHQVQAQRKLSAEAKLKLEIACDKAARGEVSSVGRIAEEVCTEVIKGSGLKPGPERERALAACKAAKK
jgi:hypothetical protein